MENSVKKPKSPKVLMLSPYFVPRKRVGALRSYKFAKHLKDLDWQVCVIHLEAKGQRLSESEKNALNGVGLFGLKTPFDRTINRSGSDLGVVDSQSNTQIQRGSEHDSIAQNDIGKGVHTSRESNQVHAPIQRAIDEVERFLPLDTWYPLLRSHLNYMEQILIQEQPDLLWVTADPWSGLSVVRTLSKRIGIPFVADFRDPFTLCPIRTTKKSSWVQKIEKRLEAKVIQEAAAIVFTAEETLKMYQKTYAKYAEKMHVIHNAYDTDLINRSEEPLSTSAQRQINEFSEIIEHSTTIELTHDLDTELNSDPFKLLFLGKFRSSSPIDPLIESFNVLKRNNPAFFSTLRLYHIGTLDVQTQEKLNAHGLTDHFESLAPIPYDKVPDFIEEFDALISLLNPIRNMVIPSKFWDYLPATPPIISIGSNNEMNEILTTTQRGYQFESSQTKEIADKMYALRVQRGAVSITRSTPKNHFERIKSFSAEQKTRELSRLFLSVIKK
jgi:glycosyltransferase involved in cell wall biosynthesis